MDKTLYVTDLDGRLMRDDKTISPGIIGDNNSDSVAEWLKTHAGGASANIL